MHTLTLMFRSTQKTEELLFCAAVLPVPLLPPLSITIATLPPFRRPLHCRVEEPSITSAAVAPPPSPIPPTSTIRLRGVYRVQEGMLLTSSWHGVLLLTMTWHCPPPPSTGPQKQQWGHALGSSRQGRGPCCRARHRTDRRIRPAPATSRHCRVRRRPRLGRRIPPSPR